MRLFLDLGGDLVKNCEHQKNDDSTSLLKVFRGPGAALGGYLGSSWRYVESSCRQLRATWRQDGTQTRQDEPT